MSTIESLDCLRCGHIHAADHRGQGCERCSGTLASNLRVRYRAADRRTWDFEAAFASQTSGLARFSAMLPVGAPGLVSLGEGGTPLHRATRLGQVLGIERLYIKDESANPTHSYKDRLSAVAVSHAKAIGAPLVATASSGNAGASLAAYAARAGLPCLVASMQGASGPMVSQMRKLGAHLVLMEDKTMRWPLLAQGAAQDGWFITSPYAAPVVGSTPIGIEGYKTIAYEIFQDMRDVPDWLALPVCYGDALAGIHQGFLDLQDAGLTDRVPRFLAAEAHGSLGQALATAADHVPPVVPAYAALAASVGAPQSAYQALRALQDSNGVAVQVTNVGLVELQETVGALEGLFFELASVMPFAAVRRLRSEGAIRPGERVVCLATASGLKDIDKSTQDWEEIPVENRPLPQVFQAARTAAKSLSHQLPARSPGAVS